MQTSSLFSDFLTALEVPHTEEYSNAQFTAMPFQSLFGLTKLLFNYGISSEGLRIADKQELAKLPTPFLADTPDGFLIVTSITSEKVDYISQGEPESATFAEFSNASNGVVLIAYPDSNSCEPQYGIHRRDELIATGKKWILAAGTAALFLYLFISNGIYTHLSTIFLTLINIAGLWLTYMLVQKTLKIKSKTADRVCGVLQEGGCDKVLELKASKFFGIFSWSEVGFTYFSVSLLTLLIFPQWISYLALCNLLCLPFTFWSIWYQKFRAKKWCTLCVSVQASLWLLFFCYFFGGWYAGILPLRIEFFVLGATYVTVLMALNSVLPMFNKQQQSDETSNETNAE